MDYAEAMRNAIADFDKLDADFGAVSEKVTQAILDSGVVNLGTVGIALAELLGSIAAHLSKSRSMDRKEVESSFWEIFTCCSEHYSKVDVSNFADTLQ